jgi:hypothetical protein
MYAPPLNISNMRGGLSEREQAPLSHSVQKFKKIIRKFLIYFEKLMPRHNLYLP